MLILADENFPRRVVDYLRRADHDVVWAGNDFPSSSDKEVLERAETDGRILFTLDRDFRQIAIQRPNNPASPDSGYHAQGSPRVKSIA
jgi:predicted nuclease of predicted toxin-antitoxin system